MRIRALRGATATRAAIFATNVFTRERLKRTTGATATGVTVPSAAAGEAAPALNACCAVA